MISCVEDSVLLNGVRSGRGVPEISPLGPTARSSHGSKFQGLPIDAGLARSTRRGRNGFAAEGRRGRRTLPGTTMQTALSYPTSWSDEEIVGRVLSGDGRMFEAIMRRHNTRLFRAARAITGNDYEAEDVMDAPMFARTSTSRIFRGSRASRRGSPASPCTRRSRGALPPAIRHARGPRRRGVVANRTGRDPGAARERHRNPTRVGRRHRRAASRVPRGVRFASRGGFERRRYGRMPWDPGGNGQDPALPRSRGFQRSLNAAFEPAMGSAFAFHRPRCDRVVYAVLARIASP